MFTLFCRVYTSVYLRLLFLFNVCLLVITYVYSSLPKFTRVYL